MEVFTPTIKLEHSDARGEIYSIALPGNRELMLLHSKKGSIRGGHSHDVDETVVLLTGKMAYYKRGTTSESREILLAGNGSFNPAGLIHMGKFLEDSWVIEQKLAKKGEWKNLDYQPWREKAAANAAGR